MTARNHVPVVHERSPVKLDVLGMAVTEIDRSSAVRSGMEMSSGLIVVAVRWGSAADLAGVTTGDIISEVDGKVTRTLPDLDDALAAAHGAQAPVRVLFRRVGTWRYLSIPFEEIALEEGQNNGTANVLR